MDRPAHNESMGEACECFRCHINTIQVSPAATPSRRNNVAPSRTAGGGNSWERGVPTDRRGMPNLHPVTGQPIGQKQWAGEFRRKFTDAGVAG